MVIHNVVVIVATVIRVIAKDSWFSKAIIAVKELIATVVVKDSSFAIAARFIKAACIREVVQYLDWHCSWTESKEENFSWCSKNSLSPNLPSWNCSVR